MPEETSRRYLFVAIDRATRWVFIRIYKSSCLENSHITYRDVTLRHYGADVIMANYWFEMFKAIRSGFALCARKFMPPQKFETSI